jgi:spore coat protein A, manganese oxidase
MKRRDFLTLSIKAAAALGGAAALPRGLIESAFATPLAAGLSDPALQDKFVNAAPNALDPAFRFAFTRTPGLLKGRIGMGQTRHWAGIKDLMGNPVLTTVWGYGRPNLGYTWPGRTIVARRDEPLEITWENRLFNLPHLLPVDTSFHWAYGQEGYERYSIARNGVPVTVHLHGGHSDSAADGIPQSFYSPGWAVRGPHWEQRKFLYQNDQDAGTLWYHDHALGLTRLNVYAGLAGFYILRDAQDTGGSDNAYDLPYGPYELAYAIQDRMFNSDGQLFYPAHPGDPFWDDFITDEGVLDPPIPSGLAEFFGDHMIVNGIAWPKAEVEPRRYRVRLLNGTDSRFMILRLRPTDINATTLDGAGAPMPFTVIGSDQGFVPQAAQVDELLIGPGERYDVLVDFAQAPFGTRVIVENIAGDSPFGGHLPDADDLFPNRQTDRVMAFDVVVPKDHTVPDRVPASSFPHTPVPAATKTRRLALFEGSDEFGRLQPMLGTAEPVLDMDGNLQEGSLTFHDPITENPALGATEEWEIYNATGDAHPIHVHLVHFEVINRESFTADLVPIALTQHNGAQAEGFKLADITNAGDVREALPVERGHKDVVTMLPDEVTRIRMTFDKPGRYVWHCHILSHEDHDMMRAYHVGPA